MTLVRLARIALAVALLFTVFVAVTLPFPPSGSHERMTWVIFGTVFVLEAVAMIMLSSKHVLPRVIVYALGVFGFAVAVSHLLLLARGETGGAPMRTVYFVITLSVALFVAGALTLVGHRRLSSASP